MNFISTRKNKCLKYAWHFSFFLFIFFFSVEPCSSQTLKENNITIRTNKETIEKVFTVLSKDTNFKFFYDKEVVNNVPLITLDLNKTSLQTVLNEISNQSGLSFKRVDNTISVSKVKRTDNQNQKKQKVTGIVLDEKGEVVIGATIIEKGSTSNGTVSDMDGKFSMEVSQQSILSVSYIGYTPQLIAVGNQTYISVKLKEDTQSLDEVVVVAYGTQKKSNLTGSVEVVTAKDLQNRPVTSASSLLQGQVAGMTFSTPGGGNTPGSTPTIQIRGQAALSGSTPPLVVIDGIPADMGDFNALNPTDIESVSVLKDAAASAVYGARAPYGVLMVTTKMGKKNEKPVITYSGNYAVVNPVRMPEMADSYTFALLKNQGMLNSRTPAHFNEQKLDLIQDNILNPGKYTPYDLNPGEGDTWGWGNNSYENNDFIDIWLKSSFRHQHDLSLKGGGERTNYFVSAGYVYQPGIFEFVEKNDNYTRFNINGGVETQINNWIKLTYRSRYSYATSKEPCFEYNWGRSSVYNYAYGAWPVTAVKNPDGYYNEGNRIGTGINAGVRKNMEHRLDNILALDLTLAKGWTAHADATWRINMQDNESHRKPVSGARPSGSLFTLGGTESSLSKEIGMTTYWTIQGYTAYEHKIKDHTIRLQLGAQAEESAYRQISGDALDLFLPDLPAISVAQGKRTFDDSMNDWATAGFFGRLNYNFADKYLVEVNGRYDGSGRYSKGTRWGFFPSGFAAWNMSKEGFWENIKPIVNYSKIKASYGTLGNQGNSAGYLHIPTMVVESQAGWIIDGKRNPYVKTPGILNMMRTWEKITTLDVGLELKFLDNRLAAEFGYFNRESWDIIGPATPKASVLGVGAPEVNNASFRTTGWELQLSWRDMITTSWDYGVNILLSDARSKVTKYNTTINSIDKWYVGKEFGEIWGYKAERLLTKNDFNADGKLKIDQSKINSNWFPGDVKYEDLNGDNEITTGSKTVEDSGDLQKIGNNTPRYRFGINLSSGYDFNKAGRIDLSLFFEGIAKRDLFMNSTFYYWGVGAGNSYTVSVYNGDHMDFYRDETAAPRLLDYMGTNTDAFFPRPYDNGEGGKNFQTNTKYMVNGAYLRLKNLQLAYTLPKEWLNKAKINNCRVYFSGENLFVLSALPGYLDPEFVDGGRMYPQQAVYSLGVNIGF